MWIRACAHTCRDTGYIIGGGATPPTLLIPLLDPPSVPLLDKQLGKVALK